MKKTHAASITASYLREAGLSIISSKDKGHLHELRRRIKWNSAPPSDIEMILRAVTRTNVNGELFIGWMPEGIRVVALPECSHGLLLNRPGAEQAFHARYVVNETTGCWEWMAGLNGAGYGSHFGTLAHRYSWSNANGAPIPKGMQIDHLCRNKRCCNPRHLECVTPQVNNSRSTSVSAANIGKTHCPKGHPYHGTNLYLRPDGKRDCKRCKADAVSKWRKNEPGKAKP